MADVIKIIGECEIAKLALAPGDVLVARVDRPITSEIAHRVSEHIKAAVPEGTKILVLDSAIELSMLRKTEIEKMTG